MERLSDSDYARAAGLLGCEPAAIKAVAAIEAPFGGFLPSGQPTILFERHWFHKLTFGKYDTVAPDISNPNPGGYSGGEREHVRLARAVALDRDAALKSASWGKFQIMGFNYGACGMKTLQEFINNVYTSEQAQLGLFVNFMRTKGLGPVLGKAQFQTFAFKYNGPNYSQFHYDTRIAQQYRLNGGLIA